MIPRRTCGRAAFAGAPHLLALHICGRSTRLDRLARTSHSHSHIGVRIVQSCEGVRIAFSLPLSPAALYLFS